MFAELVELLIVHHGSFPAEAERGHAAFSFQSPFIGARRMEAVGRVGWCRGLQLWGPPDGTGVPAQDPFLGPPEASQRALLSFIFSLLNKNIDIYQDELF